MKRDEQIRKALNLVAPPAKSRAECRADIESVLDVVELFGKGDKVFQAERSAAANRARDIFHKTICKALREYDAMVKARHSSLLYPTDPENPFRGLDGRVLLQWLATQTAPPGKHVTTIGRIDGAKHHRINQSEVNAEKRAKVDTALIENPAHSDQIIAKETGVHQSFYSLLSPKKPIPDVIPDGAGLSRGSGKKNRAARRY